jgi:hypothetical protein
MKTSKKAQVKSPKFVDFDSETGCYGVFDDTGHCYATFCDESDAEKYAETH